MANAGDLITQAQAFAWLSQTTDPQGVIATAISSISTQIQNFIGYQIAENTYTRTMNGLGGEKMLLRDRPVLSVSSLTIDSISIPQGVVGSTSGYLFDDRFIYLYGGISGVGRSGFVGNIHRFTRGVQNVTVSYTAGYATVPYDLQQATLYLLGAVWEMVGQDPTVGSRRAGDTQIDFKNSVARLGNEVALLPPSALAYILPYRRVAT